MPVYTAAASQREPLPPDDPEVKNRTCLNCFQGFLSQWVGNRICDKCKLTSALGERTRTRETNTKLKGKKILK